MFLAPRLRTWLVFLPERLVLCNAPFRQRPVWTGEKKDVSVATVELRHAGEDATSVILKKDGGETILFKEIDTAGANWIAKAVLAWQTRK